MICKNCNMNNVEGAKFCTNCSSPLEVPQTMNQNFQNQQYVPNMQYTQNTQYSQNMQNQQYIPNQQYAQNTGNYGSEPLEYKSASAIVAIIFSILCCGGIIGAIFAILSLVEGSKVKSYVQNGDFVSAKNSLEQAKKWNKIAWIIIAVVGGLVLLYCIFVFFVAMLDTMYYY